MARMGFPKQFVNWISLIQSNNLLAFHYNNKTHTCFPMTSRVRQGDPVAGTLFILGMEPLAQSLRNNQQIDPIPISTSHSKLVGLHVDDVWVAVANEKSAEITIDTLHSFERALGMETNCTKSFALNQIGTNLFGLAPIPETGFKHLGIPVGPHGTYFDSAHHIANTAKLTKKLKNLHLSLNGCKAITHSYILSPIIYQLYVLTPDQSFYNNIDKLISSFIWNSRAKVSKSKLVQSKDNRGIGLWDLRCRADAAKTSLLMRILKNNSDLSNAINEIYYTHYQNNFCHPNTAHINNSSNWLKTALKSTPPTNKNICGIVALSNKPNTKLNIIHNKRIYFLKHDDSGYGFRNGNLLTKKPGNHFPISHTSTADKKGNLYTITKNNLNNTFNNIYDKLPNFKDIYDSTLNLTIPPPPPTEATLKRLTKFNLTLDIFKQLWTLSLRPKAKEFFYLFLLNSNPFRHGHTCPFCPNTLNQHHLWENCDTSPKIEPLGEEPLAQFINKIFSRWLVFCHFSHNDTPLSLYEQFF